MVAVPTKPRSPVVTITQMAGPGTICTSTAGAMNTNAVIDVVAVSPTETGLPGTALPIPRSQRFVQVSQHCSNPVKQQRAVVMAGVAIALASTGLAQALTQTSDYEGRVQITLRPDDSSVNPSENGSSTVTYDAIAAPTVLPPISLEQQVDGLTSSTWLDPAIARLQAVGIEIDYASLVDDLQITPLENSAVIEISYRAADPQQVQTVLNEITESYTHQVPTCNTQTCHNVEFMQAQVPLIQSRIETRQTALNAFHQQHRLSEVQTQNQQAIALTAQLQRQSQQTQAKLKASSDRVNALAAQLGQRATVVSTVLAQDSRYQLLMDQLRSVEALIAQELQQPQMQQAKLAPLYDQYQTVVTQLREQATQTGNRYWLDYAVTHPAAASAASETDVTWIQIQEWFDAAHYVEVLKLHQQTLSQLNQRLDQRTTQLTALLGQETHLQQQLQDAKTLLEQYSTKLQALQTQIAPHTPWEVVAPPEMLHTTAAQPASLSDIQRDVGMGVLLGALFGIGVAVVIEGRDRSQALALSHHS